MDETEINKIIKSYIEEHKKDRWLSLGSAEKIYSDLNQSELIVATGAFALIVNFFIGNKKFENLEFLFMGVSFLVITIIAKSLSFRWKGDNIEREIAINDERTDLVVRIVIAGSKKNRKEELLAEEQESLLGYPDNYKKINDKFDKLKKDRITGKVLNEVEFYSYISGIIFILGFFILNALK